MIHAAPRHWHQHWTTLLLATLLCLLPAAVLATPTHIARDGQALMPVVVGPQADEQTQQAAEDLAQMLTRITGATFEVTTGDGRGGLAVGTLADFPALNLDTVLDATGLAAREQYLIRTHGDGVYIIGQEPLGAEHGVWDFLHRIGFRQFFPTETWEVAPSIASLTVDLDVLEQPDWYTRKLAPITFGLWDHNRDTTAQWYARNRGGGFQLRTGHVYDGILRAEQAIFDEHPEYLALVNGVRRQGVRNNKFCIGNPDARAVIVANRVRAMDQLPDRDSISIDPSDGGNWCECELCAEIGSISDQAVLLANEVAEALVEEFGPDIRVGMYAYFMHGPPPTIQVHPNVVISIATAYIRGGYSAEGLAEAWEPFTNELGIREYYCVTTWNRDLPGRARASNTDYLTRTIPRFHQLGARFMHAEASDNWGPNGLGYYLAMRMFWDVNEANNVDALREDFIVRAFGDAHEPMRRFYNLIDGANSPLLSDDLLGRMYRLLDEARSQTDDPRVLARLDDLILWTHYVELFQEYREADGHPRQQAFENLIRHVYRIRNTQMVSAKALYRDMARRDQAVTIPSYAAWNVAEEENPWKDSTPFTREEIDAFVTAGIANHELLGFQAIGFSDDLIPLRTLLELEGKEAAGRFRSRGNEVFYVWVDEAPATLNFTLRSGLIRGQAGGEVRVRLFPDDEVESLYVDEAVIIADGEEYAISLQTEYTGLHRVEYFDGMSSTILAWPDGTPVTWELGASYSAHRIGRQHIYFYVPYGTPVIGGFITNGTMTMRQPDGEIALEMQRYTGFFEVPVPEGQDGKVWRIQSMLGRLRLMTVPPYVAGCPLGLLVPREVVEAAKKR